MDAACVDSPRHIKDEDDLNILRMAQRCKDSGPRMLIARGDNKRLFPSSDAHERPWQSVKKGNRDGLVPLETDLCKSLNPGIGEDGTPDWMNAWADLKDFGRRDRK